MGTYEELIPKADMVLNLTPDKQHTSVVTEARAARLCACPLATMPHAARCASTACVGAVQVMPLMKKNAVLAYSHGFNIVEEGMKIRKDLTVPIYEPSIRTGTGWSTSALGLAHVPQRRSAPLFARSTEPVVPRAPVGTHRLSSVSTT